MYCRFCGKEIDDGWQYCQSCGHDLRYRDACGDISGIENRPVHPNISAQSDEEISGTTIVLTILGFIFPFIGLIGSVVMLASGKNRDAGIIGTMTIIGFVFWFLFWGY